MMTTESFTIENGLFNQLESIIDDMDLIILNITERDFSTSILIEIEENEIETLQSIINNLN